FRIDPASCRVVVQGTLTADRILLNARALGVYGASPISEAVLDRAIAALPDTRFAQAYGMTELSPIATILH
ncbi:hypothetical protein, partial [Proteus vulgaris]|uniref:hypothetical protein n=1 Tax=Proteus vulgaris TaxID=585 RepID=UPI00195308B2